MPTIRRQNACSFCRTPGHNVKNCNDARLSDFEETCQVHMIFCNSREIFKDWLLGTYNVFDEYNKCLLRTFSIKKCNATMRTPMFYCLDLIADYMHRTYIQQNQTRMNNNNLNNAEFIQFMSNLYNNNPDYDYEQAVYDELNELNEQINGMQLALGREMFAALNNITYNRHIDQVPQNKKYNISLLLENNNNYKNNENAVNENMDCSICLENKSNGTFVKFDCQHEFCKDCVVKCLQNNNKNVLCCALCRGNTKTFKTSCPSTYDALKILVV
jgi:hypothetical protein